jgi:hypothetical protein
MLAPKPFIPRNTTMPIITATIPIPILPILAKIFPILISSPFNQRPAVNPDTDVVVRSTAERPAPFPGAIPSDIEEVACQRWCEEEESCGCECVELHCEGGLEDLVTWFGKMVDESWDTVAWIGLNEIA